MASNYYKHKYFLDYIGIKTVYINKFLNSLSDEDLKIEGDMKIFRKYLEYNDKNIEYISNREYSSLKNEKYLFEKMGFRSHDAYIYVGMIKDIYLEDSTINWIYRLVESMITKEGKASMEKFVSQCSKYKRLRRY